MMAENALQDIGEDNSLLLLDDDEPFLRRLARAMEKRGFSVTAAQSIAEGKGAVANKPAAYAVVDLRLEDGNGLDVVEMLREKTARCPDRRSYRLWCDCDCCCGGENWGNGLLIQACRCK